MYNVTCYRCLVEWFTGLKVCTLFIVNIKYWLYSPCCTCYEPCITNSELDEIWSEEVSNYMSSVWWCEDVNQEIGFQTSCCQLQCYAGVFFCLFFYLKILLWSCQHVLFLSSPKSHPLSLFPYHLLTQPLLAFWLSIKNLFLRSAVTGV